VFGTWLGRRQELDCHIAVQKLITGAIHNACAAASDLCIEAIAVIQKPAWRA
jgi:hypothetical protein